MRNYLLIKTLLIVGFTSLSAPLLGEIIDELENIVDDSEDRAEPAAQEAGKSKGKLVSPQKIGLKKPVNKVQSKKSKTEDDAARKKLPILLKSDGEAVYSKNRGVVHLVKNVRISQGILFFRADEAKVFFIEVEGESVVEKVEIFGNVRITKRSQDPTEIVKASGNRAIYLNSVGLVTLIGNAKLWQGGHLIKGKQITYELSSGIIKVDRAEGVVQPKEQKK